MDSDDARNVDQQLDEQQAKIEERRQRPLIENHGNNARIDPPPAGDPRMGKSKEAVETASGGPAGTVTEAAKGTEGTAPTGEEPEA